jgi:FlaA1/EpsC-like NDP-sugar epimerase
MGEPVTISDLAKKMIRLFGYIPNIDIDITYSGLRPGEKLYEELLSDAENTLKTYHEKIMIAKVREVALQDIEAKFNEFRRLVNNAENENELVALMKALVPEFISNNSVYEQLDSTNGVAKVVGLDD